MIETTDGLTHDVVQEENGDRFGVTRCGITFSVDEQLVDFISKEQDYGHRAARKTRRRRLTCIMCWGSFR